MSGGDKAIVIGGGVVGECIAVRLQEAGLQTLVLDRPRAMPPASWGNAGHIALEQVDPLASPHTVRTAASRLFGFGGPLDFRWRDVDLWLPWAAAFLAAATPRRFARGQAALRALMAEAGPAWRRLTETLERDDLLIERGHMILWEAQRTAAAGQRAWAAVEVAGLAGRPAGPDDLAPLQGALRRPPAGGFVFSGTAQVSSPAKVLSALKEKHTALGGDRRRARVVGLSPHAGGFRLLLEGGQRLEADVVVVAAGVGSRALMESLGHQAPVIAERGYHVEADAGDWPRHLPPVVFEDRSMIVTRFGDRLRASSFAEFGREDAAGDPRKWRQLERHLADLGVPIGGAFDRWVGARPTLPDYLPAIGRSDHPVNLFYAFGHQHLGLTLSAPTGELVADLVLGRAPPIDLAAFDLGRFSPRRSNRKTKVTDTQNVRLAPAQSSIVEPPLLRSARDGSAAGKTDGRVKAPSDDEHWSRVKDRATD